MFGSLMIASISWSRCRLAVGLGSTPLNDLLAGADALLEACLMGRTAKSASRLCIAFLVGPEKPLGLLEHLRSIGGINCDIVLHGRVCTYTRSSVADASE
ncbi:hypothetical protein GGX14DRAFT_454166 [Mycena pura]|uniref:Uncharacterized protein n=1 Tax=Mycena pura TaxID=153505 RepID=A0AAD6VIQ1_9AGAR|nr:hypothetical protein GGX14DRAFT_454166 [Mycena pura]